MARSLPAEPSRDLSIGLDPGACPGPDPGSAGVTVGDFSPAVTDVGSPSTARDDGWLGTELPGLVEKPVQHRLIFRRLDLRPRLLDEDGAGPGAEVGRTRRGVESESPRSVYAFAVREASKEGTIPKFFRLSLTREPSPARRSLISIRPRGCPR